MAKGYTRNCGMAHSVYAQFLLILQHLRIKLCLNHENSVNDVADERNCVVSVEMRGVTPSEAVTLETR